MYVRVYSGKEFVGTVRALCDTGAQPNLVVHKLVKNYYEHTSSSLTTIVGIDNESISIKRKINLSIKPWFDSNQIIRATFLILPTKSNWSPTLPARDLHCELFEKGLPEQMADPFFWKSAPISMLFGVEMWAMFLQGLQTNLDSKLICQNTKFGGIVMGWGGSKNVAENNQIHTVQSNHLVDLNKAIERFWYFENLELCTKKDAEHELCEQIFKEQHARDSNGRFIVAIPMKPNISEIGSTKQIALKRFLMLEKRFQRDEELRQEYIKFMREFEELNHMVQINSTEKQEKEMVNYIPHHGVKCSHKFRVVFDASCKSDKNISLNEVQIVGEKLQRDLLETIMRFRRHPIAVSADIKMMYRQIKIIPEHWNLQRIFWREKATDPLKEYHITRVIYGMASAPHCSVRAMIEGANSFADQFPVAVKAIKNDFYVDDCFTGANNENDAIELATQMKFILEQFGFPLCKWKSNCPNLVLNLEGNCESAINLHDNTESSVLGLKWLINSDEFAYSVQNTDTGDRLTKRLVLSKIAQLYDPNGFVAPFISSAKIFMQTLWKHKLDWDDKLPDNLASEWKVVWAHIEYIQQIRIPRYLGFYKHSNIQVHGFSDASTKAYGAVIYVRYIDEKNNVHINLISAKSKIAPIKIVSIPRLELAAAELLSSLFTLVVRAMEWSDVPYFLWSDSTVTLHWLQKGVGQLKIYIANRVTKIRENSSSANWHHVRTEHNPADLISRGTNAKELVNNSLWWNGPEWLAQPQESWPKPVFIKQADLKISESEMKTTLNVHNVNKERKQFKGLDILDIRNTIHKTVPLFDYSNNLYKLVRIVAYILRFIESCKSRKSKRCTRKTRASIAEEIALPNTEEKLFALNYLIRMSQYEYFRMEINHLAQEQLNNSNLEKPFPDKSKISNLCPILDNDNILRVGGRINRSQCEYDKKHPIIISGNSRLCYLIIRQIHMTTNHGSVQVMMQAIREKYWITHLRNQLRMYLHKCVICAKHEKKYEMQLMSDLPAERINRNRAFLITGVDYAGPIDIVEKYKRKSNLRKCWIAVFVCMVTRAIHLDVVTDLTSAAFIACYERFVCRRGHCNKLYSDNGTTFKGANHEIHAAFRAWHVNETKEHINKRGTDWHFSSPAAPHQGGIYEAAVKSMKHHLLRMMGRNHYTYEYLVTLLVQIEAILNSRPLYPLSHDPSDTRAITPGHFLIGEPFILPPPIAVPAQTNYSLKRIRDEQRKLIEHFWNKWSAEYLCTLIPRKKWLKKNEQIKEGQLVVLPDGNLPASQWLMGRIIELIPSKDGLIRSVKIQTHKSIYTRPIQKISILPIEPNTS